MKIEITGILWLNEQDPYEPTGIMIDQQDLALLIMEKFNISRICDFDEAVLNDTAKKVKIIIEESDEI